MKATEGKRRRQTEHAGGGGDRWKSWGRRKRKRGRSEKIDRGEKKKKDRKGGTEREKRRKRTKGRMKEKLKEEKGLFSKIESILCLRWWQSANLKGIHSSLHFFLFRPPIDYGGKMVSKKDKGKENEVEEKVKKIKEEKHRARIDRKELSNGCRMRHLSALTSLLH